MNRVSPSTPTGTIELSDDGSCSWFSAFGKMKLMSQSAVRELPVWAPNRAVRRDRAAQALNRGSEGPVATDSNIASDDRIGGYRYIRTIHPGATSVVMEVLQEGTQRRFALKQLLASRAEDRDEVRAFMHEANLGKELRHPNLIRVYELVKDKHQPYFVMELFTGLHLKLPIARPSIYPMPKRLLHRIIEQAASALAYMHDHGWAHRDVKPENILFNKSGEVRVIDYALARRISTGLLADVRGQDPPPGNQDVHGARTDPLRAAGAGGRYLQPRNHLL